MTIFRNMQSKMVRHEMAAFEVNFKSVKKQRKPFIMILWLFLKLSAVLHLFYTLNSSLKCSKDEK